jgi:hypothetical protein
VQKIGHRRFSRFARGAPPLARFRESAPA